MHDLTMSHGCPLQSSRRGGGNFQVFTQKASTTVALHTFPSTINRDKSRSFTDQESKPLKQREAKVRKVEPRRTVDVDFELGGLRPGPVAVPGGPRCEGMP